MAYSSDEIIKREILDTLGHETKGIKLRIFPQSSNVLLLDSRAFLMAHVMPHGMWMRNGWTD